MGFIADTVSNIFGGGKAAKASKQAANIQAEAGREAIAFQKEALAQTRADLQPFREAGQERLPSVASNIDQLNTLVSDPNAQRDFITNNPFYEALAKDAETRILSNQAAKGKVGSGETAKALQNSLLLLGSDLLNQNINQMLSVNNQDFNLTALGANAAARQATATQNTSNAIGNTITDIGNAQASGIVGASNAKQAALGTGINTGLAALALSDETKKTDIEKIGVDDKGLNIYTYRYKRDKTPRVGHMAQEVEKKYPNAVKTIADIKMIDYGVLNAS